MKNKVCSNCEKEIIKDTEHCPYCGKNFTSKIESADVVDFFSNIFYAFGVAGIIIVTLPVLLISFLTSSFCFDATCGIGVFGLLGLLPPVLIGISHLLRKLKNKMYLKNIGK